MATETAPREEPSDDPFVTASFRALPPVWQQWSRERGREVTQADLRRLRGKARARRAADATGRGDALLPTLCLMLECAVEEQREASAARAAEGRRYRAVVQRQGQGQARRRAPRGPPCLQCAAKGHMRCSWEGRPARPGAPGEGREWRCARCARGGEAFCVRQRVDLTVEPAGGGAAREGALRRGVWCADPAVRPAEVQARAEELLLLLRNGGRRQRTTVSGAVVAADWDADGAGGRGGAAPGAPLPAPLPAWHTNDAAVSGPGGAGAGPRGWRDYFLDHGEGRLRRAVAERKRLWGEMGRAMGLDAEEMERGWGEGEARASVRAIFGWYLATGELDAAVAGWLAQRQLEGADEVELPSGRRVRLPPAGGGRGGLE